MKKGQIQKALYCILFILRSGKGKIIGTETGQWLPEAEGGERGLTVKIELVRMMEAFCLLITVQVTQVC